MLPAIDQLKARIESAVPDSKLEIIPNDSPAAQPSLLVARESLLSVARFLRDDPDLRLDYASNVTGVDWPELVTKEKINFARIKTTIGKPSVPAIFQKPESLIISCCLESL